MCNHDFKELSGMAYFSHRCSLCGDYMRDAVLVNEQVAADRMETRRMLKACYEKVGITAVRFDDSAECNKV